MKRAFYVLGLLSAVAVLTAVGFAAAGNAAPDGAVEPARVMAPAGGEVSLAAPGEGVASAPDEGVASAPAAGEGVASEAVPGADVAILPMPEQEAAAPEQSGDGAVSPAPGSAEAAGSVTPESSSASEDAAADAGEDATDGDSGLPQDLEPWTEEEIAALRELAREWIASRRLAQDVYGHLERVWEERIRPWLEAFDAHGGDGLPDFEAVEEWLDEWLDAHDLPARDELGDRWDKVIGRLEEQTGVAIEDLQEIGRAWFEGQRELFEQLQEDIKELRQEMGESWAESGARAGAASRDDA